MFHSSHCQRFVGIRQRVVFTLRLFGKDPTKDLSKKKSLHELIVTKKETSASRQQNVKLLDENRSRAVGIKLRSLHCDMNDIRSALYRWVVTSAAHSTGDF